MNRGSTQPLITQGDMKKVVVLVPDKETLAKFEALAGSLMAQWEANNNENVKLASLRDTLLPKLMSGELDVSNIDLYAASGLENCSAVSELAPLADSLSSVCKHSSGCGICSRRFTTAICASHR